jgi:ankyrin repeat protein
LDIDPLLVHDCDDIRMTPIHWACMRGYERLVDILIAHHSDLKSPDLLDRTPEDLSMACGNTAVYQSISKALNACIPVKIMIRMIKDQQAKEEEDQKQKVVDTAGAVALMVNLVSQSIDQSSQNLH